MTSTAPRTDRGQVLAPVALTLVAVALLSAGFWACGRGLDRVDESYVLAGIAHPDASRAAGEVTFSGFVLHPLFVLAGGDIAIYRGFGVALVTVLSAVTMDRITRCTDALTATRSRGWRRHLPWIGAAATSLTAFTFGLRSLSYNSLVLVGLLVTTIGVSLVLPGRDVPGGAVIAAGWWVVFLGKPTSAAALGVVGAVVLLLARRVTLRAAAAAVGALVVVVGITLVAVHMSPAELVAFLAGGVRQDQILGGHVSLLPLLGLGAAPVSALLWFGPPVVLAGVVAVELAVRRSPGSASVGLALVGLACAGIVVAAVPSLAERGLGPQLRPFALVLVVLGAWMVARELSRRRAEERSGRRAPRELIGLTAFLGLMPYAAAVGTNSPFTEAMPHYAVFWLMATLVGLRAVHDRAPSQVVAVGVALGVTAVLVATALVDGGPSASLLAADVRTPVAGGTLLLPAAEAGVAGDLNAVALRGGLTPDTPVVDLTGISPGYALQLGGRPLGRESFMGVFPGAPDAAAGALGRVPCADRSAAWLLWADHNPWGVAGKVDLGRVVPEGYDVVGRFSPVQGPAPWRTVVVDVLRPRADASTTCPA